MRILVPAQGAPNLDWAIYYGQIGWEVLPLHYPKAIGVCSCGTVNCSSIGKHPLIKNGVKGATADTRLIRRWWNKWPEANVGIATGQKSGLLIVDIDPRHDGHFSLRKWESNHGKFETLKTKTGGGGEHFFFAYPRNQTLGNKVNLEKGIDIRANGGYVVAPPSIHASGQGYTWDSNQNISETPPWLLSHFGGRDKTSLTNSTDRVDEGARNSFLASLAGSFKKYGIKGEGLNSELKKINTAYCNPPLEGEEVIKITKSISNYPTEIPWQEPLDIPDEIYHAPNMGISHIPKSMQPWISDITKRMQVPIEFVAAPAIVAISSLIGRKIGIHPKKNDNWLVYPNLWGAVVARPGFFKSPTIAEAMKPLEKIVSEANQKYDQALKAWEIEKSIIEATIEATKDQLIRALKKGQDVNIENMRAKMKSLKKELDTLKPVAKRYKTNDATVEKVSQLLLENPDGILMVRDELYGWLASMNKSGREGDREFYLEAWNGYGSFTIDRIGRGTLHIPSLCLSVFGGIQPSKLEKHVVGSLNENDDGLLQRMQILVYPEIKNSWKNYDICPDEKAQLEVDKLFRTCADLTNANELQHFHFDDDAQAIFNHWRENLEKSLRSGQIENPNFESHISKFRSLMPSLSLLFQIIESQAMNGKFLVGKEATKLSIRWCEYLEFHAKKVYKVASSSQMESARALAKKIREGKVTDQVKIRSIYRHHWAMLNTIDRVNSAIQELAKFNWVRVETKKGSRTQTLRINPSL